MGREKHGSSSSSSTTKTSLSATTSTTVTKAAGSSSNLKQAVIAEKIAAPDSQETNEDLCTKMDAETAPGDEAVSSVKQVEDTTNGELESINSNENPNSVAEASASQTEIQ